MNRKTALNLAALALPVLGLPALAQTTTVTDYEDLPEGFYGTAFVHNGVIYHSVNNVSGVFPDGSTFEGGDGIQGLGTEIIVENASLLFDLFPSFGSRNNVMTFGRAFVVGDNLSLGALSTVSMDLSGVSDFASLDLGYLENGPWGGIVYHLDALMDGSVVASDSFTIAGGGDRDNFAFATLSVGGVQFDSLRLFATFGGEFSGPRGIIDNLTVRAVPAPGSLALLGVAGLAGRRRRA